MTVLETCNHALQLEDPMDLADISNSHRLPAPRNSPPGAPRPLIVKFTNNRARRRVFQARSRLKEVNRILRYRIPNDDDDGFQTIPLNRPIYMNEDLSSARLKLAYEARQLKRAGKITDTWVIDGKVKIKDNHNIIVSVGTLNDLEKYKI